MEPAASEQVFDLTHSLYKPVDSFVFALDLSLYFQLKKANAGVVPVQLKEKKGHSVNMLLVRHHYRLKFCLGINSMSVPTPVVFLTRSFFSAEVTLVCLYAVASLCYIHSVSLCVILC